MKIFMLKAFLLASLMFICVLAGMQLANDGMDRMRGYEDPSMKNAFTVGEGPEGKVETEVLGTEVSSQDLKKKKEKLEQMESYNFFSDMGRRLGDAMTGAVGNLVEWITGKKSQD
ncbi:YqxA family protein [Bacillus massilinigeriensis]|uniref:YqxA family protein n=1 Tax=Bacillus mediterraneensis TaxID=1805474 RepID=UPI0008F7F897|nr:YqxA family protein [Bacillus mediterraneensis]